MTSSRRILYLGTYERDYPRNQQLIRLLRRADCQVVEIHQAFWELYRDKSRGVTGVAGAMLAGFRLLRSYALILPRMFSRLRWTDAVMIGYIGQLDMLVLAPILRLARIPVIFNPLITLTDTLVEDRALLRDGSLAARAVRLIDMVSLKLASAVISDTPQNAEYMAGRFGLPSDRIWTVDVGADESTFIQLDGRRSQPVPLHVLFYGKMIPLHGIDTILAAVERLHQQGQPDITFEIIGSGQLEHHVCAFQARYPDAPVNFRPWVAYRRLAQRISNADVVLGIFGSGDKAGRVIPNKVYQAMAVGAPIITRDSPAVRRVLRHGESAMLVPAADPDALANAVLDLRDDDLRGRLGRTARAAFEQWGSDAALSANVRDLLDHIFPVDEQKRARERPS